MFGNKIIKKFSCLFFKTGFSRIYFYCSFFLESIHWETFNKITIWNFFTEAATKSGSLKKIICNCVQTPWKILMKEFIFCFFHFLEAAIYDSWCLPVNLRTSFFKEHLWWMILYYQHFFSVDALVHFLLDTLILSACLHYMQMLTKRDGHTTKSFWVQQRDHSLYYRSKLLYYWFFLLFLY